MILLIQIAAQALVLLVIVRALLSWFPSVNTHTGVGRLVYRATDPILRPIQRVLPAPGGIDLSPVVAILLIQFLASAVTRL